MDVAGGDDRFIKDLLLERFDKVDLFDQAAGAQIGRAVAGIWRAPGPAGRKLVGGGPFYLLPSGHSATFL